MNAQKLLLTVLLGLSMTLGFSLFAQKGSTGGGSQKGVIVGGAPMYPSKNIIENAQKSKDHTTLLVAMIEANLVKTLLSAGPFTVFAPTNAAFDKLPKGTVATVLKPENSSILQSLLKYHVVEGKFNAKDVIAAIKAGNGKAELKTVNGGVLTASLKDNDFILTDANGGIAKVTIADVNQSNGVIHVINNVLNPKGNIYKDLL